MTNASKKRVLMITPFAPPNIGGAEVHLADYYDYLRGTGHTVTVLTYQPLTTKVRGLPLERREGLTIVRYRWIGYNLFARFERYPPIVNFLYLTPYLFLRSFIFLCCHRREFDVIHVFGLNAAFVARILHICFRKPIYVSMEALYGFDPRTVFGKICAWVLGRFAAVLVGSEESRADVLRLGISGDRVVVYSHWVNLDRFRPGDKASMKKKLGWEERFTVLYVGRLIPAKGIAVFLQTIPLTDPEIRYKVVGTGPEESAVRAAARTLPNLEYVGGVSNTKLRDYYVAANLLVYPALYDEDVSLTLIESMACGTPVVNTNRGSGHYALTDQVGFVVEANPHALAEKVQLVFRDPVLADRLSHGCVRFAAQFGPQLAERIAAVYDRSV